MLNTEWLIVCTYGITEKRSCSKTLSSHKMTSLMLHIKIGVDYIGLIYVNPRCKLNDICYCLSNPYIHRL